MSDDILAKLRNGECTVWFNRRPRVPGAFDASIASSRIASAEALWQKFAPALARLFDTPGGHGKIWSPLFEYSTPLLRGSPAYVKADHALPISACVKARGGIFGLLCVIQEIAGQAGLLTGIGSYEALTRPRSRQAFSEHTIIVASTGNLGFTVGVVATAFGLKAEVHMSHCAKGWKKDRLRALGVTVVEHAGDYTSTVTAARANVAERDNAHFIDDENSWDLFLGYAGAGAELAAQLDEAGVTISVDRPLVVYLPCGVGGAPGGITYGLRALYGDALVSVFVEPTDSACMLVALATAGNQPPSVYDVGLENLTEADGLAVGRASAMVLEQVRDEIDAAVAVPDVDLLHWLRRVWAERKMKLEPSAAAGFAALSPFLTALPEQSRKSINRPALQNIGNGVHVVWTTGGDLMPEEVFQQLI